MNRAFIPAMAEQAGDTIVGLWRLRSLAVESMNYRLKHLVELDNRIEANVDVLRCMGAEALRCFEMQLSLDNAGELFASAIFALEAGKEDRVRTLCAVAEALPETKAGLSDAICWVSPQSLRGIIKSFMESPTAFQRAVGIAACASQGVNPGKFLKDGLMAGEHQVRAAALRAAGELGVADTVDLLRGDEDDECRYWAAWASLLLGRRGVALDTMLQTALTADASHRLSAFRLALQALPLAAAHAVLQDIAKDRSQLRWLIQGSGIVGDPAYLPWLIGLMPNKATARLAGEAFTLMTGVDLRLEGLEGSRPEDLKSGPNDDPKDSDVEMDKDEGLPWPNCERINVWWAANDSRFQRGERYFMGASITREHCIQVLKGGYQRERMFAAYYLCLLSPGTPLFNTGALASRQQQLLAGL